jgi:N-glycosylase/DNA lyase
MESLLESLESLKKTGVKKAVDVRLKEFKELGKKPLHERFKEMCFCMLTANYTAAGGIRIKKAVGDGFILLSRDELAARLRELGHRFPDARAGYIVEARKHMDVLEDVLRNKNGIEVRDWLVRNIKGLGYKESSHFLRNLGYENLAIVDFHIVDILGKHGVIERPKTMTPRRYLEIERVLQELGKKLGMNMAELDLYLWHCETGKILK